MQRQLSQAGITLRTDLSKNALVTGYPAELRQVFTNLLANAADASTAGGLLEVSVRPTLAVRSSGLRELRPAGATVTIADHGTGIAPETLDRLFQPFFTTKGEKGTGLGLWVSQGIAQKHGGDIHLDTRTGPDDHGTTASVFLPRGGAPAAAPPPPNEEKKATASPQQTPSPAGNASDKSGASDASAAHDRTAAPLNSR
jgi:signal transduction histidine kinase